VSPLSFVQFRLGTMQQVRFKNWLYNTLTRICAVFGGKIRHVFMVVFEHVWLEEAILGWYS